MRKLTFNFYDGRNSDASKMHKVILTRSDPYTHVELVDVTGLSFSSEFGIGPRFKNIKYTHPERWHKVILYVSNAEYDRIWYRAEVLVALRKAGKLKYDDRGILGAIFSGTFEDYECNVKKAFNKLNIVSMVYRERTNTLKLKGLGGGACGTYYGFPSPTDYSTATITQINADINSIESNNKYLQRFSCPTIY